MSASSPIADLTYRNYDGPMGTTDMRWWAIAKMTMWTSIKRRGFITWSILSAWYFILMIAVFYFMGVFKSGGPVDPMSAIVWKDQFLIGYDMSQLMLFIVALLIGAGIIANDNRANALLIYLSKPCSKRDYLFGKWLGLFIVFYGVSLIPSLIFWSYTAMSFREYGSISSAPWLPLQLIVLAAIPACMFASVCVGVSSLFNQGRLAIATLAGIYLVSNLFTKMLGFLYMASDHNSAILRNLFYGSVDGLNIGVAKLLLGTEGRQLFNANAVAVLRPDILPVVFAYLAVCVLSVLLAWARIRPVEVVG